MALLLLGRAICCERTYASLLFCCCLLTCCEMAFRVYPLWEGAPPCSCYCCILKSIFCCAIYCCWLALELDALLAAFCCCWLAWIFFMSRICYSRVNCDC